MEHSIIPVKGMKDYYPEEFLLLKYLENIWIGIGKKFGYSEYEGPTLEPVELYLEKSSEEIVREQTFRVEDRNGKTLILRPEMTPTLARMVSQKERELDFPLRWQSFGRFYRYEKPQKGRSRAFYQWNVDLIGSESIMADIEMLQIACDCLQYLGLSDNDVEIRLNNRQVFQKILNYQIGIDANKISVVLREIDRMDKIPFDTTKKELVNHGLSEIQIANLVSLLDKDPVEVNGWFSKVNKFLLDTGIGKYFKFDFHIIRGFDYYTGIVFEAWAKTGLKRALFGGGRYDNLTKQVGGKLNLPGVGFAVGDVAISELLKELNKLPQLPVSQAEILVSVFDENNLYESLKVVNLLRGKGHSAELYLESGKNLTKQLKYANKKGFEKFIIIGPDEIKNNQVMIKDLKTGEQKIISRNDL